MVQNGNKLTLVVVSSSRQLRSVYYDKVCSVMTWEASTCCQAGSKRGLNHPFFVVLRWFDDRTRGKQQKPSVVQRNVITPIIPKTATML
jgi:hypothetical protein